MKLHEPSELVTIPTFKQGQIKVFLCASTKGVSLGKK